MITRFPSIYGGIETIVGTYTAEEIRRQFPSHLSDFHTPSTWVDGKLFDFTWNGKEILGYMTEDHRVRLHCINR